MTRRTAGWLAGAVIPFLLAADRALADAKSVNANINDIKIKWQANCDAAVQELTLGGVSITLVDSDAAGNPTENGNNAKMEAALYVSNAAKTSSIWDCMNLCWFQVVYRNDGLAIRYAGELPTISKTEPVVDPPNGGWDYMYKDEEKRKDPDLQYSSFIPDDGPCYNNADGRRLSSTEKEFYSMLDVPSDIVESPLNQVKFSTYLVAEPKKTCDKPECLKPKQMLLLAGFDWTNAHDPTLLDIDVTYIPADDGYDHAAFVNAALGRPNLGFPGWTAVEDGVICCPEPVTLALFVIGAGLMRRSRRRAA